MEGVICANDNLQVPHMLHIVYERILVPKVQFVGATRHGATHMCEFIYIRCDYIFYGYLALNLFLFNLFLVSTLQFVTI